MGTLTLMGVPTLYFWFILKCLLTLANSSPKSSGNRISPLELASPRVFSATDFAYTREVFQCTTGGLRRWILHLGRLGDGDRGAGRGNEILWRSYNRRHSHGMRSRQRRTGRNGCGDLGLGLGPLSFPNHVDGGVFSYCLPDRESDRHSSLIFGDAAIPDFPPSAVKFTPQLRNPRVATYYYIQITGISVGGNEVTSIPASAFELDVLGNGGTIVDSGTTITRLQTPAYRAFRDAFRDATQHLPAADEFAFFDTCYDLTGMESISVPTVTFHFQGGYEMRLPPANYIVPVNNNDTYCFAFAATAGPSIVGNVQQQGFQVISDNLRMQIGFYLNQC